MSDELTITKIQLPVLPYPQEALDPHISSRTLSFHHDKHHQAYVTKLNSLIEGTNLVGKTLEDIINLTFGKPEKAGIFNNAGQVWNHTFYWNSMYPKGGGKPEGKLAERIDKDFGSFEQFKTKFSEAALNQFGSGWCWLIVEGTTLKIMATSNADTPIAHGFKPLFTIDVWEHAYYLDYQNRRVDYISAFMNNLVNWKFAQENFGS